MNPIQPSLLATFAPVLGMICLLGCGVFAAEQVLTYPDLVRRMWDSELLARLPEPGERGALFSSYGRSSRYDEATDQYLNWGANEDQQNGIRKEGEALVLAEMKGAGCIWSAQPGIQLLKFEVVGKHADAKPRYGVCLDSIRLVREK